MIILWKKRSFADMVKNAVFRARGKLQKALVTSKNSQRGKYSHNIESEKEALAC